MAGFDTRMTNRLITLFGTAAPKIAKAAEQNTPLLAALHNDRLELAGYNDFQRVAEFIGVAPDPGTAWATLRIGELKAMLYKTD